ncbi:FtsW/RodA/SpoVE family cell cycle protein [Paenibacillus sp. MBLB4367]|uniref:FtsW/RodA/SpoVE family cell cycle protein n=1 Tax=Paenibacillus sp. MBLB4367 TaxID=3384767 RepID=UPI003907F6EB
MLDKIKKIDWSIVFLLCAFAVISTLLVYSATLNDPDIKVPASKSLIIYTISFVVFLVVALLDFRIFIKTSWFTYGFGILLLVAVYLFGAEINGAKGWFKLPGGFLFQPAELVKLLIIIAASAYMAKRNGEQLRLLGDVIPVGVIVFVPFVLVLIQPDLGNAVIYLVILLGLYWIGNIKYTHVLIGTAVVGAFLTLFFYLFIHFHDDIKQFAVDHNKKHWVERIDTFIMPDQVSEDEKYQSKRAKIAIGSGLLTGDGYLKGNSVHKNFIPFAYSDSIFVVVGEEFGFVGGAVLLMLYFLLIYRMILISIQSTDLSGSYLIVGIVAMYVFQVFQNIGMFIGLMPITGITLPFVSYGGTSLLINMIAIGLVMSVKLHQEKPSMFKEA